MKATSFIAAAEIWQGDFILGSRSENKEGRNTD